MGCSLGAIVKFSEISEPRSCIFHSALGHTNFTNQFHKHVPVLPGFIKYLLIGGTYEAGSPMSPLLVSGDIKMPPVQVPRDGRPMWPENQGVHPIQRDKVTGI